MKKPFIIFIVPIFLKKKKKKNVPIFIFDCSGFGFSEGKAKKEGRKRNQPTEFFEIHKPHISGIRFYHNEISIK